MRCLVMFVTAVCFLFLFNDPVLKYFNGFVSHFKHTLNLLLSKFVIVVVVVVVVVFTALS